MAHNPQNIGSILYFSSFRGYILYHFCWGQLSTSFKNGSLSGRAYPYSFTIGIPPHGVSHYLGCKFHKQANPCLKCMATGILPIIGKSTIIVAYYLLYEGVITIRSSGVWIIISIISSLTYFSRLWVASVNILPHKTCPMPKLFSYDQACNKGSFVFVCSCSQKKKMFGHGWLGSDQVAICLGNLQKCISQNLKICFIPFRCP